MSTEVLNAHSLWASSHWSRSHVIKIYLTTLKKTPFYGEWSYLAKWLLTTKVSDNDYQYDLGVKGQPQIYIKSVVLLVSPTPLTIFIFIDCL